MPGQGTPVTVTNQTVNSAGATVTQEQPTTLASSAVPSAAQTAVAAGYLIAKASAGNLYGYEVVAGASAGYLMLFDSTTVPADGTVTPKKVHAIAANASLSRSLNPPIRFSTGIVAVFSTTGPFTKTISATAFLGVDYA